MHSTTWNLKSHPITLTSWSLLGAVAGGGSPQDGDIPAGANLYGSNNGTNWTLLTVVNAASPAGQWYNFSADSATAYQYLRLDRPSTGTGGRLTRSSFTVTSADA